METTEVLTKTKWSIDQAHSEIDFKVKHLMVANVKGSFREFDASIYTTGEDFITAEVDFWLNPASIDTGDKQRDTHLKSADFFDVKNFMEINFQANTIEKVNSYGNFGLYGDLTMKGIKKQIKMDVEFSGVIKDPWGNQRAIFTINGEINRKDWGLNWNVGLEAGGLMVSEKVWFTCELQLIKQASE